MKNRQAIVLCMTILLTGALLTGIAGAEEEQLILKGNSELQGASTNICKAGNSSYLKLTAVDPNVNRLRIVNAKNHITYDGHPTADMQIYLPSSSYTATVWSAHGTTLPGAVHGTFVDSPSIPKRAQQQPPYTSEVRKAATRQTTATITTGGLPGSFYIAPNKGYRLCKHGKVYSKCVHCKKQYNVNDPYYKAKQNSVLKNRVY